MNVDSDADHRGQACPPNVPFRALSLAPGLAEFLREAGERAALSPNLTPQEIRHEAADMVTWMHGSGPHLDVVTEDRSIAIEGERSIPVRVYTPREISNNDLVIFIHGGGWIAGSIDSYDPDVRRLSCRLRRRAMSLEYRLAPEHPFPAGLDDCVALVKTVANEEEYTGLALAGDSAGGNLALATALELRRSATRIAGLLLIYPALDASASRNPSYLENAEGYLLTATMMKAYWEAYLAGTAHPLDPRASPAREPNLWGLPPTVLVAAGLDPLRDESRDLAVRLIDAGVDLTYLPNAGLTHAFLHYANRVPSAGTAVDAAFDALDAALTRSATRRLLVATDT